MMKVRLQCNKEKREELERMLRAGGFEVSSSGELVLYEENFVLSRILLKDENGGFEWVDMNEIEMVESFDHILLFYVGSERYSLRDRLYAVEEKLPKDKFVRISQSCIVNRLEIVKIVPTFGSRYDVTMRCGVKTCVTKSYFLDFKKRFGL